MERQNDVSVMPSRQREVEVETSVGLGLSLTGVTKRFPGVVALDDVTFNARPGEIHALVGRTERASPP